MSIRRTSASSAQTCKTGNDPHRNALRASLMGLFTGAALLAVIQITITVRSTNMGPNESDTETRRQLDEICDRLRSAQANTVGSGKQVFSAATASSLTYYTDSSGDTVMYWLNTSVSPEALEQTTVVSPEYLQQPCF